MLSNFSFLFYSGLNRLNGIDGSFPPLATPLILLNLKFYEDSEHLAWVLAPPLHGRQSLLGLDDLGDEFVNWASATLQIADDTTEEDGRSY